MPALLMVGASIGPAMVTLAIGGQMPEMIQRVYLFSLMPISFFGVYLLLRVKTAIILVPCLLAAPFFSTLVHYGDQAGDYLTPDYAASVEFFHDRAAPGLLTMRGFDRVPFGKLRVPSLHKIQSYRTAAEAIPGEVGDYVVLTASDQDFTVFFGRLVKEYQAVSEYVTNNERYNLVYSSPGVGIYAAH